MRDNRTNIGVGAGLTAGYTSEGIRAWKQTSGVNGVRTYFVYDGMTPPLMFVPPHGMA